MKSVNVLLDSYYLICFLPFCRYADAVLEAVHQLGMLLSGQQPEPSTVDSEDGWGIFMFFCATVAAVVGWSWHSNRKQQTRYKV